MMTIDEINKIEDKVISTYEALPVWRIIGVEALPVAEKTYMDAFEIRKSYMEYLVGR